MAEDARHKDPGKVRTRTKNKGDSDHESALSIDVAGWRNRRRNRLSCGKQQQRQSGKPRNLIFTLYSKMKLKVPGRQIRGFFRQVGGMRERWDLPAAAQ